MQRAIVAHHEVGAARLLGLLELGPAHGKTPFQGAYGSHGLHFLVTHDSDNATLGVPVDELDGQQWRFSVPMSAPTNVLTTYAPNVVTPLQPVVTPYSG